MRIKLLKYQIFAHHHVTERVVCHITLIGEEHQTHNPRLVNLAFFDGHSNPLAVGVEDPLTKFVSVALPARSLNRIRHLLQTEKELEGAWEAAGGQLQWFRINGPLETVGPG